MTERKTATRGQPARRKAKRPAKAEAPHVESDLTGPEIKEVEEHGWLPAPFVYQVVRQEGLRELSRPATALWWSGLAAGMLIGLSVLVEALLHLHLPDAPWRFLVENLGYCVGFVVVILSRHQLFTENTLTAILPLMADPKRATLYAVARLWLLVAVANLAGALIFAGFWTFGGLVEGETLEAMRAIGREMMTNDWPAMFVKAVAAGFLMASLVWLLPSAQGATLWGIVLVTWVIAIGDLTHIVAGGVEALLLLLAGELPIGDALWRFGLPVLLGNVVGGSVLFGVIVYAQVKEEVTHGNPLGHER